ncbi:type IV pilus assembly protein PilA [Alkalibacterium subtropicum]|uniref:Type IV pilus assembly protein PilA n=1 Tax=Alkalibacterium subtropicum TaxID=753702 RepID=A0A1I1J0B0_9LACT|nr:type II secretion system protein [Alkalibacterium subtropicum]SFC41392.1 type IV pilus assembly protein PilA [Alkalibacterium subtropicum]
MRNKIKQLMNKEEGFTLVELLAVIVILGIILAIAIPSIGGVIDRASEDAATAEETLVVDAGRLYFVQNPTVASVTVETLVDEGYIDERQDSDLLTSNFTDATTIYQTENGGASLTDPDS